jgi:phosphoglycerol geranylgeranyltransferase
MEMTVLETIRQIRSQTRLHITLIDPDKQSPMAAGRIAQSAARAGSDAIMIGGSSRLTRREVNLTVEHIKAATTLPTVLFVSSAEAVAPAADALLYISLLNSRSPQFLIRELMREARFIRESHIEPISTGYLIVEPGMRAGEVGQADLIHRDDLDTATLYAIAAESLGMAMVYLEAGSGAPDPVPTQMVAAVRRELSTLLCVGGGIRHARQAAAISAAGADIIVTGTIVEGRDDVEAILTPLIAAVKMQAYSGGSIGNCQ